jgi:hypothetical protein
MMTQRRWTAMKGLIGRMIGDVVLISWDDSAGMRGGWKGPRLRLARQRASLGREVARSFRRISVGILCRWVVQAY